MSFDLNEQGREYQYIAVGHRRQDFGMLSAAPFALLESLHGVNVPETQKIKPRGCLHRLTGFLFQLSRVADHAGQLSRWSPQQALGQPVPVAGSMVVMSADEACFDFEALLFHARAALDRLTWFVAGQHAQRCDRFTKLPGLLGNFAKSSARARAVLEVLRLAKKLDGIVVDVDGSKALRSKVAHHSSILEGREITFTTHFLSEEKRLIFDCEALGYPLLATSELLSTHIPFVVLNAVAIYSGMQSLRLDVGSQNLGTLFD
jgi:hypothetical protein